MKLSLILLGLSAATTIAGAKTVDGYCNENAGMVLSGELKGKPCSKASKKCSLKKAVAKCEKIDACAGLTCTGGGRCVIHSNATLVAGADNMSSWLKADDEDCTQNRVVQGGNKKKKDEFGFTEMMMINSATGGDVLDPTVAMMMGAKMEEIMMMQALGENADPTTLAMMMGADMEDSLLLQAMGKDADPTTMAMMMGAKIEEAMLMNAMIMGENGEIDPAMLMMMGGNGDMGMEEILMMQAMMGDKGDEAEEPKPQAVTTSPRGCVGGTRVIQTSTGPKVVCASSVGSVVSTTSTPSAGCLYGSRVVTTSTGSTITVCNPRVISTIETRITNPEEEEEEKEETAAAAMEEDAVAMEEVDEEFKAEEEEKKAAAPKCGPICKLRRAKAKARKARQEAKESS